MEKGYRYQVLVIGEEKAGYQHATVYLTSSQLLGNRLMGFQLILTILLTRLEHHPLPVMMDEAPSLHVLPTCTRRKEVETHMHTITLVITSNDANPPHFTGPAAAWPGGRRNVQRQAQRQAQRHDVATATHPPGPSSAAAGLPVGQPSFV